MAGNACSPTPDEVNNQTTAMLGPALSGDCNSCDQELRLTDTSARI